MVDYQECCFAKIFSDGEIKVIFKDTALIPNKHRKGGQSAARYSRNRQNQITEWFKDINERLKVITGEFYVGISSIYYKRFYDTLSTYNKQKVKERKNSEYSGLSGIYQMIKQLEAERKNAPIV